MEIALPLSLGLIIGLVIGLSLAKQAKRKSASLSGTGAKALENEVLQDQVKQLEAKIKTLEKALEITSKN